MKTIAIDFDGVIHKFSKGWQDGSIYDDPIPGAFAAIKALMDTGYAVFIHSTRDAMQIADWMNETTNMFKTIPLDSHFLEQEKFWNRTDIVGVTNQKLPAQIYIDDRAMRFNGDWEDASIELTDLLTE